MSTIFSRALAAALSDRRVLYAAVASSVLPAFIAAMSELPSLVPSRGVQVALAVASLVSTSLGVLFAHRAAREKRAPSQGILSASLSALPLLAGFVAVFVMLNLFTALAQSVAMRAAPGLASVLMAVGLGFQSSLRVAAFLLTVPFVIVPVYVFLRACPLPLFLTDPYKGAREAVDESLRLTKGKVGGIFVGFMLPMLVLAVVLEAGSGYIQGLMEQGADTYVAAMMVFVARATLSAFGMTMWAATALVLDRGGPSRKR